MKTFVLASALLGARATLASTLHNDNAARLDPDLGEHNRHLTARGTAAQPGLTETDVTCQLRHPPTPPGIGFEMNSAAPLSHGNLALGELVSIEAFVRDIFMTLSEDALACSLRHSHDLDASFYQNTPYCNQTQIHDCAKASGSPKNKDWIRIALSRHEATASEIPELSYEYPATVKLVASSSSGKDGLLHDQPPVVLAEPEVRPAEEANRIAEELAFAAPASESTWPSPSGKRAPASSKPSASGNKQIAGMAGGLVMVLLIFVIWL